MLEVNRTDWLFTVTQASNGGHRQTEKLSSLHPAIVNTSSRSWRCGPRGLIIRGDRSARNGQDNDHLTVGWLAL
ncbi:MAG TPA: hypothetical protein VLH80_00680 [Nitrospiraceae bacterium]|jgi:hypothetical protein|nr:hypothetical protein [Nitrospiraceae bacterium]